ncbi:HipA domain-containing protein [Salinibacterium sp. G-O1]|uniref:HipA domain-containing protein n=1 Tax=Salinibacterium sp. G-O1 TaxID=3046208 RepID=UPI0024BAC1E3|nr:HipA domain-containing protein [Salinibacterium sp. G-O1]MDJ0333892.1 HipA domain-containing protein [Salinibacterium sp. G-O1]
MTEDLDVHMYGYRVGTLTRIATEDYLLVYDENWSSADESVPLSISLPLSQKEHRGRGLTNFIDNLLPDNPDVRQRWATDAGLDSVEPFLLLREYGQDVAGAASFRSSGASVTSTRRMITGAEIADRIREIRSDDTAWHDDRQPAPGQFSLGGAQRKFSLARHGEDWFETSGDDASTHLFKPQVEGVPDGELVEYLVMRTAYLLGIPTARVELFTSGGQHSLVVERFDRRVEHGQTIRLHQEDLLQALGQPKLRKYEKHGGPGIDSIAAMLSQHADAESLRRYAAMLFFSWIVLSTDAHAKNYSIFLGPEGASLTPMYDASSVLPYLGRDPALDHPSLRQRASEIELSVRFGASNLAGDVARFELETVARQCRMASDDLLSVVALQILEIGDVMSDAASDMPAELQTDTIARVVDWMPVRAKQAAEAIGVAGLLA